MSCDTQRMAATSPRLRATAALAVGALALHQSRYLLGYGGASGDALSAHGHGYLTLLVPLLALLAAAAAAQFLTALARADGGAAMGARRARFATVWLAATLALLATYAGQELLEGLLAAGHPAGAAALLAGGGWWALPLAVAVGLALALLLRAATVAIEAAARRRCPPARRASPLATSPASADLPTLSIFGRNLAGRAPPPLSV